ncbi:MAG: peptidylprolyl isomerase [Deltaproteobacteria bacterium]|nr:peptidylprolyl isomerase [Deltaproteobacteria bacterium]
MLQRTILMMFFLTLISQTFLLAHPRFSHKREGKVLVKVNSVAIYEDEFRKQYQLTTEGRPYKTISKKEFLDYMINVELAVQRAQKLKLDETDLAIEAFRTTLHNLVVRQELAPKINAIKVEEKDLEAFFKEKGFLKFSQIVLIPKEGSQEEWNKTKTKAQNIKGELKKTPTLFEDLAKRHSNGPSANVGGDIGFKTKEDLFPELIQTAFALKKVGDISEVLKSSRGFHIFKLTEKPSFEEIKKKYLGDLQFRAQSYKQMKAQEQYYEDLKKQAHIVIVNNP